MKKIYLAVTNDLVTDNRVHKVACTLLASGSEVTVIGRRKSKSAEILNRPYQTKRFRLMFNQGAIFYLVYNIRLFLYLIFKRFDIVVANDLDTLPGAFYASKLRFKKLVYDSHEYFTEVPELINRKFPKKVWEILEKNILPKIKHAYTVSETIAEAYKTKYGISMSTVRNLPKFSNIILEKKHEINHKHVILYQGALNVGRGLEQIIEAMEYIENAKLVIIGDGDIKEQLEIQIREKGLVEKIEMKGLIPFDKLPEETRKADLGIALEENLGLSYYYSLPNKLFDYIQARIPVLTSPFPEMQKIVNQYNVGTIYEHKNPKELASALKEIFRLKNRYNKWKENTNIAAKELCWEKEEIILKNVFEKLGLEF